MLGLGACPQIQQSGQPVTPTKAANRNPKTNTEIIYIVGDLLHLQLHRHHHQRYHLLVKLYLLVKLMENIKI